MAEDNEQQSPFTRPGFVAATVVIALIVVLVLSSATAGWFVVKILRSSSSGNCSPVQSLFMGCKR